MPIALSERGIFYPTFLQGNVVIGSDVIYPGPADGDISSDNHIFTSKGQLPEFRKGLREALKMKTSPLLARLDPDVFANGPLYVFQPPNDPESPYLIPVPKIKINRLPLVSIIPDGRTLTVDINARKKKMLYYCIVASVHGLSTEISLDKFNPVADYIRVSVPYDYDIFFNLSDQQVPVMGIAVGPNAAEGIDVAIHPPILEDVRRL